jgi:hypothetical protein
MSIQSLAANTTTSENPAYTAAMFTGLFPQFAALPDTMLTVLISHATTAIMQERWGVKWEYAAGLYIAHHATLLLQAYNPDATTTDDAVKSGLPGGLLTSQKIDGMVSVTLDHAALITESWGMWNATLYGRLLATEAKLMGLGGAFII